MTEFEKIVLDLEKESSIIELKNYIQHHNFSRLEHCLGVAYTSYCFAKKYHLNINYKELIRGCMLHDYYFYDWHNKEESPRLHGYAHSTIALTNAELEIPNLTEKEKNMIYSHMWPLNITKIPKSKEAIILCIADKYCATKEVFSGRQIPIQLKQAIALFVMFLPRLI